MKLKSSLMMYRLEHVQMYTLKKEEHTTTLKILISPESIQALQNAFLTMQNALKSFSEAVNEALVNAENENHETVIKLMEEIGNQPVININRTRKEVKLPRKLRNGWR